MYDAVYDQLAEIEALASSPWAYAISAVGMISTILLLVFMHFSAKHRNKKLSAGWYICGYLFPLITVFVFLNKRKRFPGPNMKVCLACGDKYPPVYEVCGRCLAPLPDINEEEQKKSEKIAKITFPAFWVAYIAASVASIILAVTMVMPMFDLFGDFMDDLDSVGSRIAITNDNGEKVYYDKKGNAYDNAEAVVIYGKDGTKYTYDTEAVIEDGFEYENELYVSDKGDKFDYYLCYVDENGWFVYDKDEEFDFSEEFYNDEEEEFYYDETSDNYYSYDGELLSEEEVNRYYSEKYMNYKYYEDLYYDSEGNGYYWAGEASWNEKGELITAENDPTVE